jgi:hypothetical protein
MMKTSILRFRDAFWTKFVSWRARTSWSRAEVWAAAKPALATAVTLVIPAYVFLLFNDGMRHNSGWGDEGYFVWCGWSLLKGLVPYRDFMEFKPPFVFLTYALALKLFGFKEFGFRTFFTYFPLLSVLALQLSLLTRRIDKVLAMGLSLALVHLWVTHAFHDAALSDTESIGLAYYFLGTACLLARTPYPAVAQGLGTALLIACTQSKDPYLPCAVVTWAACFFVSERTGSFREDAVRYIKRSTVGGGVLVIGLLLYLVPTGGLRAYLHMLGRYAVIYRDPVKSFCVAGGVWQPTTPLNDLLRRGHALVTDYANLTTMGFLIPFAAAVALFTRRRSLPLVGGALLALGMAFLAVAASNCPWQHYDNMLLGGLFFLLALGLDLMAPTFSALSRPVQWMVRVAMLSGLVVALWPRIEAERAVYGTRTYPSAEVEPDPGVFDLIRQHTTPADRIVTNGNPILYVQVDRLAGVRESNFLDPILGYYVGDTDEERLRPVYEELMRSRPKIVVLDSSFLYARGRHQQALWLPFLHNNHYRQLTDNVYLRPD